MLDPVLHTRVHGSAIDHVDWTAQQVFERVTNTHIVVDGADARLIQVHQNIDVAAGLVVASGNGPEQGSVKNALNLEFGAVGTQFPQYRVTGHFKASSMGTKPGEI